jgi:lysophospholipid acyltransferase (LPLAT)-like uncharacterized protein
MGRNTRREPVKQAVRRFGKRLLASPLFLGIASAAVCGALYVIYKTNRFVDDNDDIEETVGGELPIILALWHGQQLLAPFIYQQNHNVTALVSRSDDAEINARVLQMLGVNVIRGSGGRTRTRAVEKGGIRALKAMTDALRRGMNVVMIADISNRKPRKAGEGIVTLAKLSGRPIVPCAIATSRHHVVQNSWDKTTINLPFGRKCIKLGQPIYVPRNASDIEVKDCRKRVTDELNSVTENAYRAVRNKA